jgi:hypothetical protein
MPVVTRNMPSRCQLSGRLVVGVLTLAICALFAPALAAAQSPVTASKPTVLANGTIRVAVTATTAGTAVVSTTRLGTSSFGVLCAARASVGVGEEHVLLCVPTQTAQKLRRYGAVRVHVTLAFTPAGGSASTTRLGAVVLPQLAAPHPSGSTPAVTG